MRGSRLVASNGFGRLGDAPHFVTLGEPDAPADGGYVGVLDSLRARLRRRSH